MGLRDESLTFSPYLIYDFKSERFYSASAVSLIRLGPEIIICFAKRHQRSYCYDSLILRTINTLYN